MTDLAKRAVACKHWRWMPGMSVDARAQVGRMPHCTVIHIDEGWGVGVHDGIEICSDLDDMTGVLPRFEDPATLGCLLQLVREAHDNPRIHVRWVVGAERWACGFDGKSYGTGESEAEALVAALESTN